MNRLEFLTQLRYTLEKGGLPQNDIDDALTYYEEIFLDAGYGKDEETVASLGSPEKIAKDILIESGIDVEFVFGQSDTIQNDKTYNEYTYGDGKYGEKSSSDTANSYSYGSYDTNNTYNGTKSSTGMSTAGKLLLIILTFPLWIGVVATMFGLLVAAIAVAFSLTIGLIAGGFGLLFGGIFTLFEAPPIGLCMLGGGLICCGIFGLISRPAFRGISKYVFGGMRKLVKKAHELISR